MNSKAQFTSPCWSVENYVTKGVEGWNTAIRACRF